MLYYVRSVGGSDSNSGTSYANAWATLGKVQSSTTTGDTVYICSDESNPFITGSLNAIPKSTWVGADLIDGSPYNNAGQAYIQSSGAQQIIFTPLSLNFIDIVFDGNYLVQYCVYAVAARHHYINCTFTKALAYGFIGGSSSYHRFIDCTATLCGSAGLYLTGSVLLYNSKFFGNSGHGVYSTSGSMVSNACRFYKNDDSGLYLGSVASNLIILHNLFYDNAAHGFYVNSMNDKFDGIDAIMNNIFMSNGINGMYCGSSVDLTNSGFNFNCFYDNDSGDVNSLLNGGVIPGNVNLTVNPRFVSVIDSLEDWSLQVDSPARDIGFGYEGGEP